MKSALKTAWPSIVFVFFLCGIPLSAQTPEKVVEYHADGKQIKAKYSKDTEGRRQGQYVEYSEKGAEIIVANYKNDKLHGAYLERHPKGTPKLKARYKDGVLDGEYTATTESGGVTTQIKVLRDVVIVTAKSLESLSAVRELLPETLRDKILWYTKTPAEISQTLRKLTAVKKPADLYEKKPALKAPHAPGKLAKAYLEYGLARVQLYRSLCDVPYADVTLDDEYNHFAQHAAVLLEVIGQISHTPAQPAGVADDFYKAAYEGTTHTNLAWNISDLAASIDSYMHDSDPNNIEHVGHRRWTLNPGMQKLGFGESGEYSAFYAHDESRGGDAPEWDIVAFPPRGHYPVKYLPADCAWHATLNPNYYTVPDKDSVKAAIFALDNNYQKGKAVKIDFFNVESSLGTAVIFRPVLPLPLTGKKFLVEISGLEDAKGEKTILRYVIDFIEA